jgi:hypothetical protein
MSFDIRHALSNRVLFFLCGFGPGKSTNNGRQSHIIMHHHPEPQRQFVAQKVEKGIHNLQRVVTPFHLLVRLTASKASHGILPCYKGIHTIMPVQMATKMHRIGVEEGRKTNLFALPAHKTGSL